MDDDLNVSAALAAIHEKVTQGNNALSERDDPAILDRERADLLAIGREDHALSVRLVVEELGEVRRQLLVDRGDREIDRGRAKGRAVDEQEEPEPQDGDEPEPPPPPARAGLRLGRPRLVAHGMLSL